MSVIATTSLDPLILTASPLVGDRKGARARRRWLARRGSSNPGASALCVEEAQGLPIGHDSEIALTKTFAIGGAW